MVTCLHHWPQKDGGFRIGHLNINSILNKTSDVHTLLNNSGKPFHIFGFTESRLSDVIPDNDVKMPGFKSIRKDPTTPKATGMLIYINESLSFKRLNHLENYQIEAVWLEIQLKRSKPIKVGFVYRNPSERADWMDKFSLMMDAASLDPTEILLFGDFNINLLKPHTTWINKITSYNLSQIIDAPTRITPTSKTLIDHVYVTDKQHILELCVPFYGCSDHLPTCITWTKKGIKIPKAGHKEVTYRSFAKFDENKFLNDLINSPLACTYNYTNPEEATEFWLKTFTSIYDKHAPFKTHRVKHTSEPKWMTDEIKTESFLRDDLLRAGNNEKYVAQRKKVNLLKRKAKEKYFQNLSSSKQNPKRVWQAINELTNKNSSQSPNFDKISSDDLNKYFTTIAETLITQNKTEQNTLEELKQFCSSKNINTDVDIPFITVHEVYQLLNHLKQTGSRGPDDIDNKILKISAPAITETLTYIYNLCIEKSYFPSHFKLAKVIPVYKNGDNSKPCNYRPISILSVISKPLEKHIHKHIYHHLEFYDLLNKNQSGFRKNHSCHTALTSLVDNWLNNMNDNKFCAALFVDFAKAFDVIDHKLLYRKLQLYGLSDNCLCLLKSFLDNRQQYIYINKSKSPTLPINFGVPQGSVLGPLLFCIYVNDLPLYIKDPCELFCDDTTIHTSHAKLNEISNSLQNSINSLDEWCNLNHMSLNPQKSKLMLLTTRQKRQNMTSKLPPIYIKKTIIEEVDAHQVLGTTIDNNLTWTAHINKLSNTISKQVYQLCKIKHFLNFHTRKLFLHAYVLSSISYCSTLFDTASANSLKPLVSNYKRALKATLLKSSSLEPADYAKLGVLPLKDMFLINKGIFMYKILSGSVPKTLQSKFRMNNRYPTKLQLPIPRIDLFKSSLLYSGSLLWNNLPPNLTSSQSRHVFKKHMCAHFHHVYDSKS